MLSLANARLAPLVLGVAGGILGLLVLAGGEVRGALVPMSWVVVLACCLGFLGAGLSAAMPRPAAVLLLIAGLGLIFSVALSWFATLAAVLFLAAAARAFRGAPHSARKK